MEKAIYFDMDGTIADLYGVENWLEDLINSEPRPYKVATPLVRMNSLARVLNRLQREGYSIGIVSWLSKSGTQEYNREVTKAKKEWLYTHLKSVSFDEICIVPYGTPKEKVVDKPKGILFDDEKQNRKNWCGTAYDVNNIIEILKAL